MIPLAHQLIIQYVDNGHHRVGKSTRIADGSVEVDPGAFNANIRQLELGRQCPALDEEHLCPASARRQIQQRGDGFVGGCVYTLMQQRDIEADDSWEHGSVHLTILSLMGAASTPTVQQNASSPR
ncbi:hypothetical protein Smlt2522 [Stenotrophomonas maltophilia K279a]|uniref:Uncharacterized protein n=1 Tax=Stenotrophomonas maltophilia (strain K279a) TaxID=522373 RepID=B2FS99_STRMK|nr:hypothetical protein Smlt2522 [Stenotrophomonas maltophilia K279a]